MFRSMVAIVFCVFGECSKNNKILSKKYHNQHSKILTNCTLELHILCKAILIWVILALILKKNIFWCIFGQFFMIHAGFVNKMGNFRQLNLILCIFDGICQNNSYEIYIIIFWNFEKYAFSAILKFLHEIANFGILALYNSWSDISQQLH